MTKLYYFLFLFIIVSCTKNHQNSKDDVNADLFSLSKLSHLKNGKKEKYLDSIVPLLRSRKNDSIVRISYLKIADEYYCLNHLKKSLLMSIAAMKLSQESSDSTRLAKAFYYIGDCYENSKKDSAYYYYLKAQNIFRKIKDYENVGRMHFNKGYILFYEGNFVECEIEISKALMYLKNSSDFRLIFSSFTLMGNCLEKLSNYDDAMKYHQLALQELAKMKHNQYDINEIENYKVTSTINICNLYDLKGEYLKSVNKLNKLLIPDLKKRSPQLYANVLSNLACSNMKLNNYKNVKPMLFESFRIVDSLGIESDILYKKMHIGEYFLAIKDTVKSIEFLKETNALAIKNKNNNEILGSLKLLMQLDAKNRLAYVNKYIKNRDSINTIQESSRNKYARIEYETSNVKQQNAVLKKTNFKNLKISFFIVFILLLIILIRHFNFKNKELNFLIEDQKSNQEIYKLLTEQNEKIILAREKEKKKIARELHDGIMNKIYGVRMNLGFLNAKAEVDSIEKRKAYIQELQHIESEIRTISHDLSRNSHIEENEFNLLIFSLIESQKNITTTNFIYDNDFLCDWTGIDIMYKINIYRIIQEAVLNVNKYAEAENCLVELRTKSKDVLKIFIVDNGRGFNIDENKNGIGLANIKDRVSFIGGHINIESKIGFGTKIEIRINFRK